MQPIIYRIGDRIKRYDFRNDQCRTRVPCNGRLTFYKKSNKHRGKGQYAGRRAGGERNTKSNSTSYTYCISDTLTVPWTVCCFSSITRTLSGFFFFLITYTLCERAFTKTQPSNEHDNDNSTRPSAAADR